MRKISKREKHIRKLIIYHIGINDKFYPLGRIAFLRENEKYGDTLTTMYMDTEKLARRIELYLKRKEKK